MADNKLNYQQARKVRKSKFSDILLDQLAQKDTGVLGAIGKTISMKSQARIKGIKEKFDPLNIVKFMTMGSRFGPALFGKLTGRNQKDIDYFTGRTKSVVGSRNTADKLKKLPGNGDSEGINEQLSKIFSFLKNNREEDVRLKELNKNSSEEIAMEKGRRHKELVDTLQKLMKQINSGGTVTAEPVKENSFLDDIMEKLKGLADIIGEMKKLVLEMAKKLGMPIARALSSAGQWGLKALGAAAASGGLTVAGVLVGGTAITYGATNVLSNMSDEQLQQISNAGGGDDTALAAQATLSGRNTPEERMTAEKKAVKLEKLLEDAPFLTRVYGVGKREYLLNDKKLPKNEVDDLLGPPLDEPTAAPVKKEKMVPAAPAGQEFDAEGNLISAPIQVKPKAPTVAPKTEPVAPAPSSAPVSNLTNTNVDLNLTNTKSVTANKNDISSKTTNISNNQERAGLRPSEISVRNDEPTFMRLIQDATRLV
jgi:hypothetical protein